MAYQKIKQKLSYPVVWAFTTYFTEGFPYTFIRSISSLFFRDMGVRLESIGMTSLYGLPWVFNFLWGPLVDRFGTKRRWMLSVQLVITLLMVSIAVCSPFTFAVRAIAALFFISAIFASIQDVSIDGYYMEALDKAGQARFVGYRVMAYRIAMMTGTGVIATIGTSVSWSWAFTAAALIFGAFWIYHIYFLPSSESPGEPLRRVVKLFLKIRLLLLTTVAVSLILGVRYLYTSDAYSTLKENTPFLQKIYFSHWIALLLLISLILIILLRRKIKSFISRRQESFYTKAFLSFIDRERIGSVFTFIVMLRAGEYMLTAMVAPFFVDLGIKTHYGWIASGVGLPFSIAGAMLGGWLIFRFTFRRMAFPFIVLQNVTNLLYMVLALTLSSFIELNTGADDPIAIGGFNLFTVASVHAFDNFAGGLGTAVLMTFLMRLCKKEFKAAHYAIGTGLMNVSGIFAGAFSGILCAWLGYGYYFGISFLFSIPAMIILFLLPRFVFER